MLNRVIQLIVGNKAFFSNGTPEGFRIQFDVRKTMLGYPNEATINITNLGNDNIDQFQQRGLPVELAVGWKDEEVVRLFKGDLYTAITSRSGPDRQTSLKCLDGGQALTYTAHQNIYDQTPVSTIVEDLAGVLGTPVGKIAVNGDTGFKGRTVSGPVRSELDSLAKEYKFSWSIQDGEFFAIDDNDFVNETWPMSRKVGLQIARQIVSGPLQVQTGVEIQALLNPRFLPQHKVSLEWDSKSDFPSSLAGEYKIHNLNFTGDSHSSQWMMSMQCFTIGGI